MAHSNVKKTEVAEEVFSSFDHVELLFRDDFAVRDTRTEAGHLRLVTGGKSKACGKRTDF